MKPNIYHLNCGTLYPLGTSLLKGVLPKKIVCHCILIELEDKLILIDSGFGIEDVKKPLRTGALGLFLGLKRTKKQTAIYQIKQLGLDPSKVTDIIMTHLDLDHAGGLADFPNATVHVHKNEYEASRKRYFSFNGLRYRKAQFSHHPMWKLYDEGNVNWMGALDAIPLKNIGTEAYLIPLHGHTKGHCGVAVKVGKKWILHAGDTYYVRKELDTSFKSKVMNIFQKTIHENYEEAIKSRAKLNMLKSHQEVNVFSSHDTFEFEKCN